MRKAALKAREITKQELENAPAIEGSDDEDDGDFEEKSNKTQKSRNVTSLKKGLALSDDDEEEEVEINAKAKSHPVVKKSSFEQSEYFNLMRRIDSPEDSFSLEREKIRKFDPKKRSLGQLNSIFNQSGSKIFKKESSIVTSSKASTIKKDLNQIALEVLEGEKDVEKVKVKFGGEIFEIESGKTKNEKVKTDLDNAIDELSAVKKTLTTLDKSELDWNKYKQDESLETAELKKFKEDGFVEKQLFLERVDQRMFEKERENRELLREFRNQTNNKSNTESKP